MNSIERIMCLVGRHDWHVDREKAGRIDPDFFKADPRGGLPSCWALLTAIPAVVLVFGGGLGVLISAAVASGGGEDFTHAFLAALVLGFVFAWVADFIHRHKAWKDAVCVRCGKKSLELARRKQKVADTKLFFTSMREVEEEDRPEQKRQKA